MNWNRKKDEVTHYLHQRGAEFPEMKDLHALGLYPTHSEYYYTKGQYERVWIEKSRRDPDDELVDRVRIRETMYDDHQMFIIVNQFPFPFARPRDPQGDEYPDADPPANAARWRWVQRRTGDGVLCWFIGPILWSDILKVKIDKKVNVIIGVVSF